MEEGNFAVLIKEIKRKNQNETPTPARPRLLSIAVLRSTPGTHTTARTARPASTNGKRLLALQPLIFNGNFIVSHTEP